MSSVLIFNPPGKINKSSISIIPNLQINLEFKPGHLNYRLLRVALPIIMATIIISY